MMENLSEFMPMFESIKNLVLGIVSECHDPKPDMMLANVKELFNKVEADALQLSLFDNPAAEH